MEIKEQKEYREGLLKWCNDIFSHWKSMQPRFLELFDIKSLGEWEESCRELKEKLQEDLTEDFDNYQLAKNLYEKWERLNSKALIEQILKLNLIDVLN
jgi:hypothetical protein